MSALKKQGSLISLFDHIKNNRIQWNRDISNLNIDLIDNIYDFQRKSYFNFLQPFTPPEERKNIGLEKNLREFFKDFHIKDKIKIQYLNYVVDEPTHPQEECIMRKISYKVNISVNLRLTDLSNQEETNIKCFGESIPFLTDSNTFIINGHERLSVLQIQRNPGVIFEKDTPSSNSKLQASVKATIYPQKGSWIVIELIKDTLYISNDSKNKLPLFTFLMCLAQNTYSYNSENFCPGYTREEVIKKIYKTKTATYNPATNRWKMNFNSEDFKHSLLKYNIYFNNEHIGIKDKLLYEDINGVIEVDHNEMVQMYLGESIDHDNLIGAKITDELLNTIKEKGQIEILDINGKCPDYLANSINLHNIRERVDALKIWLDKNINKNSSYLSDVELGRVFFSRFYYSKYYSLEEYGRSRVNNVLNRNSDKHYLELDDFVEITKIIFQIVNNEREVDNIDSMVHRRIRSIGEILDDSFHLGLLQVEKKIKEKLHRAELHSSKSKITDIINFKPCAKFIYDFFKLDGLSQLLEENNLLSRLIHHRKLSIVGKGGVGGVNKEFIVPQLRDIDTSEYARICAIQTPEGQNVGLIKHLAIYAKIDDNGNIQAPFFKVNQETGEIDTDKIHYLTTLDEKDKVIASRENVDIVNGKLAFTRDDLLCRKNGSALFFHKSFVDYVEISDNQIVSISTALIPFAGNCDSYRVLTGANMNNQAVPPIIPEVPIVGTGFEEKVIKPIVSKYDGIVRRVDCNRIIVESTDKGSILETYKLTVNRKTNNDSCVIEKPVVSVGQKVKAGQIIADGFCSKNGQLAIGNNLLLLYQSHPFCFEDAVVVNERLIQDNLLNSYVIHKMEVQIQDTKLGVEEHTRDIPNIPSSILNKLDEYGIVRVGEVVNPGDILVGKLTPKAQSDQIIEDKFLKAILGEKSKQMNNTSLIVPNGVSGVVSDVSILTRKMIKKDGRTVLQDKRSIDKVKEEFKDQFNIIEEVTINRITKIFMEETENNNVINVDFKDIILKLLNLEKQIPIKFLKTIQSVICEKLNKKYIDNFQKLVEEIPQTQVVALYEVLDLFVDKLNKITNEENKIIESKKIGYELPDGVIKIITISVQISKDIEVGDKICGRYGNKGVISKIYPNVDMPYLKDGTVVDIIMSSLGVIARMNLGQILETTIGYIVMSIKNLFKSTIIDPQEHKVQQCKNILNFVINIDIKKFFPQYESTKDLNEQELISILWFYYKNGIHFNVTQYVQHEQDKIDQILEMLELEKDAKVEIFDGRTGEKLQGRFLCGLAFILKLKHMAYTKEHARSIGPYSQETQQPFSGKSNFGGQKVGEMEMWALEAHGAAFNVHEMNTIKSDYIEGRNKLYLNLIKGRKISLIIDDTFNVANIVKVFKDFKTGEDKEVLTSDNIKTLRCYLRSMGFDLITKFDHDAKDYVLQIKLASTEDIKGWCKSQTPITLSETINYRTNKPVPNGLFCQKIFGPVNNYCCACERYKGIKFEDIVCEVCEVQVTNSIVRKDNMGYIQLGYPVVNPLIALRSTNNIICALLKITFNQLHSIMNFDSYIVFNPGSTNRKKGDVINSQDYEIDQYEKDFHGETGARAIQNALKEIDLQEKIEQIKADIDNKVNLKKNVDLYTTCENMLKHQIDPSSMVMDVIPVIAAGRRQLKEINPGQYVSTDINELLRVIIYRNNVLSTIKDMGIVDIAYLFSNSARCIQRAVNNYMSLPSKSDKNFQQFIPSNKKYKSIGEHCSGKNGKFRGKIAGKRVDYSGRVVIVVNSECKMNECYVPRDVLLELLKPQIIFKLKNSGLASSLHVAKKLFSEKIPEVFEIMNDIAKNIYVFLNRQPTLHKYGFLAFKPKVSNQKAIGISPLVCKGYNADFDGDQMAIHLPLSEEAMSEAKTFMLPSNNLGSVKDGSLIVSLTKDIILGLHILTMDGQKETDFCSDNMSEIKSMLYLEKLSIHDIIHFKYNDQFYKTTVGRLLLWDYIPNKNDISIDETQMVLDTKKVEQLVYKIRTHVGDEQLSVLLDNWKDLGFQYCFKYGISLGKDDLFYLPEIKQCVEETKQMHIEYNRQYWEGFIVETELNNRCINLWMEARKKISELVRDYLNKNPNSPLTLSINSKARGTIENITQSVGMKGLISSTRGDYIPVWNNHRDGLNQFQAFYGAIGTRKGTFDVAINTAESGYLSRKLVYAAQDCIISMLNCKTEEYLVCKNIFFNGKLQSDVYKKILGRVTANNIVHPVSQKVLLRKNVLITQREVDLLKENFITEVPIRSVVFCKFDKYNSGVCVGCYGSDLSKTVNKNDKHGAFVSLGDPVGLLAASALGEPSTQLTMRSFHKGGVATFSSMTNKMLSEFKGTCKFSNNLQIITNKNGENIVISKNSYMEIITEVGTSYGAMDVPYGATIYVKDGDQIEIDDLLASWNNLQPIIIDQPGELRLSLMSEKIDFTKKVDELTGKTSITTISPTNFAFIYDHNNDLQKTYYIPKNTTISRDITFTKDGLYCGKVEAGDILGYTNSQIKSIDIVSGLQELIDILEDRVPSVIATVAPVSGTVILQNDNNKKTSLYIENAQGKHLIHCHNTQIIVQQGQQVNEGDLITAGDPTLQDLLIHRSFNDFVNFCVQKLQSIYSNQGIEINDKHMEIIVKQMCKYVNITQGYDVFVTGKRVLHSQFSAINAKRKKKNLPLLEGHRLIYGITKSICYSQFLTAMVFQKTTKIAAESAINGEIDNLQGVINNMLAGKFINSGTGSILRAVKNTSAT